MVSPFFVAALPEESFKLLALWLVLRKNRNFDEHYDGIVYAVCVGLGFAAVENVFYVFSDDDWAEVAILRALLAVPGHYAFAVLMGYYYSLYHFVDRTPQTAICILLVPFVAHGVYDALVFSGDVTIGISFLEVVLVEFGGGDTADAGDGHIVFVLVAFFQLLVNDLQHFQYILLIFKDLS